MVKFGTKDALVMAISQSLSMIGVACLVAAVALAVRYLRVDRGLRRAFRGLLLSGLSGVGIAFCHSAVPVGPLALLMLGGVGFMVWSLHVGRKRTNGDTA